MLGINHWRFTLKVRDRLTAESLRAQHDVRYDAMIAEARGLDPAQTMAAIRKLPPPSPRKLTAYENDKFAIAIEEKPKRGWRLTDPKGQKPKSRKTYLAAEATALKNAETIVASLSEAEQEIVSKAGGVEELYREARAPVA